jgi:X-Pro dipeptidyl-peptidase-like protein
VSLTLFASSSAPDTDFTGKLTDVFPDGRAIFLTDGILRARYRHSLAEPEPLTPGEPVELSLDLSVTSNVFLPGHRIRLEVSSSNFPRYDRNTNTGGVIADESASQVAVAVNRVLHGPGYPSRLILPVIRRLRNVLSPGEHVYEHRAGVGWVDHVVDLASAQRAASRGCSDRKPYPRCSMSQPAAAAAPTTASTSR